MRAHRIRWLGIIIMRDVLIESCGCAERVRLARSGRLVALSQHMFSLRYALTGPLSVMHREDQNKSLAPLQCTP